jgi:hypothetical protein
VVLRSAARAEGPGRSGEGAQLIRLTQSAETAVRSRC